MRYLGGGSIEGQIHLALAEAVGGAAALVAVPWLVSLLFKKPHRFTVRFVGVLGMFLVSWYGLKGRSKSAAEFLGEVATQSDQWKKDAKYQIETKGIFEVDLIKAEKTAAALQEKATKLDGKSKALAEAILSVNDEIREYATIYETARKKFLQAGGADAFTLTSLDEIQTREKIAIEVQVANAGLLDYLQGIDGRLGLALSQAGIAAQEAEDAIRSYKRGANIEAVLAIRELDMKSAEEAAAVISLLRNEFGKWRIKGNAVLFDRSAAAAEFNAVVERIDDIVNKQTQLQKALVK